LLRRGLVISIINSTHPLVLLGNRVADMISCH